jgi:hypothetical protein
LINKPTEAQQYAFDKYIKQIEGWFEYDDVSPYLKRRRYVCDKLVECGLLESRVTGLFGHAPNLHLKTQYRVICGQKKK